MHGHDAAARLGLERASTDHEAPQVEGLRPLEINDVAGLDDVSPHILRHTFMTWVLTAGMDLHTAAKTAGMSAKVADRVCGHLDTSRRDALNNAFRGRKENKLCEDRLSCGEFLSFCRGLWDGGR